MTEYLGTKRMRKEIQKLKRRIKEKPLYNMGKQNTPEESESFKRYKTFKEEPTEIVKKFKADAWGKELRRCKEDIVFLLEKFVHPEGRPPITKEMRRLHKLLWRDLAPSTISEASNVASTIVSVVCITRVEYGVSVEKIGAERALESYYFYRGLTTSSYRANVRNAGKRTHIQALEEKYVRGKNGKLINARTFKQGVIRSNALRMHGLPLPESPDNQFE